MAGNETYPYKVKRTLLKESEGKIDLNLSLYKFSEEEAEDRVKFYYKK